MESLSTFLAQLGLRLLSQLQELRLVVSAHGNEGAVEALAPITDGLSANVAGVWRMVQWPFPVRERLDWIEANLELGISSFDHADI